MRLLAILVILLCCLGGCRSPQAVLRTMESCNPCLTANVQTALETQLATETSTIEGLVNLGLAQNPATATAQHRINSLRHRIPQELSQPDPMVNTTTHLSPVETAAGRQAFALGVSQKVVNAERLATKAAIAMEDVRAAEQNLNLVQLEIAEKIRVACYQLLYVREAVEITKQDAESLEQIAEVILRQYEVKQSVSQQDVLGVQVEQSQVENQIVALQQKERSLQARLARLVHLSPDSSFEILDELTPALGPLDANALTAQAISARPELAGQLANIRRDRKTIHLANLQNKPDFTIGLNWIGTSSDGISPVANGDDALLLGIGFNLPVRQERIQAAICEARESSLASASQLESLKYEVAEEVYDLVAKAEGTADTLRLLQEDIIPKSARTLDLSIEEYTNGDVKYVQLIENWRALLKYRITESRLIAEYNQILASLVRSIGEFTPISGNSVTPSQPDFDAQPKLEEVFGEPVGRESENEQAADTSIFIEPATEYWPQDNSTTGSTTKQK